MNTAIDNDELIKMRQTMHKLAEFIATFETAEEKLRKREQELEKQLARNESRVNDQILQIKAVLAEFQDIMTEAGAARWRVAAEQTIKTSEDHLKNIHYATDEFVRYTAQSYEKLNQATDYTVKGLSKAIHSFRMDDFQKVTTTSVETIRDTCDKSVGKLTDIVRWFHWRNLALVFSITLVVTMITGLYINDEWPWESHQQVVQQRQLAVAVEAAWPHLSAADQDEILHLGTEKVS